MLIPFYVFDTLDDDLLCTRAIDNQVKTLIARKAEKEGHSANFIAYVLSRIFFEIKFRRWGEKHT